MTAEPKWRSGGCHCGAVRFEVRAPADAGLTDCNCSMCARTGFVHLIVDEPDFRIPRGREKLTEYRFNTGAAQHLFCSVCGIKAFYRPRSRPDGWSVNVNCLDHPEEMTGRRKLFDGRNWEAHFAGLSPEDRHAV